MRSITNRGIAVKRLCVGAITLCLAVCAGAAPGPSAPNPPGKLVDLGGHKLHVNCTGKGSPTVVIENGLPRLATTAEAGQILPLVQEQ